MKGELRRVAERTAEALGATATLEYEHFANAVINDEALTRLAVNAVGKLYGNDALRDVQPMMSSEDFAYYLHESPGVFCFLGGRNVALGCAAANHSDRFSVDEAALKRGTALYAQFACDFLRPVEFE